ncbi:hypothetical protein V6Z12_A02G160100 [Gossypium hirsutum]
MLHLVLSVLSRFLHCASEIHMISSKRVLRYLNETLAYGINFSKFEKLKLQGYFNSYWARSQDDQEMVAQSTAEAEFIAATTAVNQALWLKKLMDNLHLRKDGSIEVFVDNQATLAISLNLVFHGITKHFKFDPKNFLFLVSTMRVPDL